MSTVRSDTAPSGRRILTAKREFSSRTVRQLTDDNRLEAALRRELDAKAMPQGDDDSPVQAWARQLGLHGTALLTTDEAASLLRICERSVRQGIKEGRIPHVRMGRRLLIPVPRLLAMLLDERDPLG